MKIDKVMTTVGVLVHLEIIPNQKKKKKFFFLHYGWETMYNQGKYLFEKANTLRTWVFQEKNIKNEWNGYIFNEFNIKPTSCSIF